MSFHTMKFIVNKLLTVFRQSLLGVLDAAATLTEVGF